ncbi:hypothetical protein E2320_005898 [Naja naja]|nr:hypothetical protein E2320_005898 [Naja naja]
MKSRSHQPLILKKRKPSRPGSPAEDEEARSPAGRLKQEQQGIARDLQGVPGASPRQMTVAGDRFALINPRGVSRSPAPAEAQSLKDLLAAEQSPGKDPASGSLSGKGSLEARPFQNMSGSEEGNITASQGGPEEEKLAGLLSWTQEEADFLASQSLGSQEEERTSSEEAANCGRQQPDQHPLVGKMTSTPLSSCGMNKDTEKENQTPNRRQLSEEAANCGLNSSLTNIHWLGKMTSTPLSSCGMNKDTEKENQTPKQKTVKESVSKRPPYSYMAMIQFAINSTEKKRMMLKDIYTWIEDNFPYFKHVAKPGWKNSVRHNLSLHDMFVRETSANGKIAFWTIHPEANRYLTLDQVFKQQKRPTLDLQKNLKVTKVEPQSSLAFKATSACMPDCFGDHADQYNPALQRRPGPVTSSEFHKGGTEGSCTASGKPSAGVLSDVFHAQEWISSFVPEWPVKEEPAGAGKEQTLCVQASPIKQKRQVIPPKQEARIGQIQKETALSPLFLEEPVLLLPLGGGSTSFPMGHCPSTQEEPLGTLVCGPEEEPPVTGRLPIASTPNKIPINTSSPPSPTDQWRLTPLVNETSKVDFSSPRSSPLPFLSFQDNLDLEFNETPLRQSLGDSLQGPLLNADTGEIVAGLLNSSSPSSKVACEIAGDNSLLEDLVLDNMPENWSKLSLDISFPDTGNDNLETDLSWSQLLPQLK